MSRNLVLFGMMGSGKSTVAALLGELLGRAVVSTDAEVEQRSGATIPQLFAGPGEDAFRALETSVIADLVGVDDVVVDLGGGAILLPENRAALRRSGLLVELRAPAEVLADRLARQPDTRPLLGGPDPSAGLERLLAERAPVYAAAADLTVDAQGPPDAVARAILDAVLARGDVLTPGEHEQVMP